MYTKSQLCKNAGITPETLRHYVDIGLIRPKEITEKGYRKYDRDSILDLWFYRLGASLGNPLKEVKKWNTTMSMEHFVGRLREREGELEKTMAQLEQQLAMIRGWRDTGLFATAGKRPSVRSGGWRSYFPWCLFPLITLCRKTGGRSFEMGTGKLVLSPGWASVFWRSGSGSLT